MLKITHQAGGTHERSVVHETVWLATFGSSIVVVDPTTLMARRTVPLGLPGETGPATDMAIVGDQLFVVIEDDSVVQLTIVDPLAPRIVKTIAASALGIAPRSLNVIDDVVYVCGHGGVVRLPDLQLMMSSQDTVNCVAVAEAGLVACIGRQALRIPDGQFIGSASTLVDCPSEPGRERVLAFTRRGAQGALVGMMAPALRELNANDGTVAFADIVRRVTFIDGRMWVVCDGGIWSYRMNDGLLDDPQHIDVLGARDVTKLDGNHLAIVGVFGRAVYRINADSSGSGSTFVQAHREAAGLSGAITDGQRILAGSYGTAWMYQINARAEITSRPMQPADPPTMEASTVDATARLSDDGSLLAFTGEDFTWTYTDPSGVRMTTVMAVDGDFWIGTDRGLTVLRSTAPRTEEEFEAAEKAAKSSKYVAPDPFKVIGEIRLPGSVTYLYPLLVGGGAAYVSEFGGFGVVSLAEEPILLPAN